MNEKKNKILWEVWYSYTFGTDNNHTGARQVSTIAHTIEEAIAYVQNLDPKEDRTVYKIEDKGFIV